MVCYQPKKTLFSPGEQSGAVSPKMGVPQPNQPVSGTGEELSQLGQPGTGAEAGAGCPTE